MDKCDCEEGEETSTFWTTTANRLGANPKTADDLKARMAAAYTRILNLFIYLLLAEQFYHIRVLRLRRGEEDYFFFY